MGEVFWGGLLSGALVVLFIFLGKGMVYLGYGKKGSEALKELEDGLPLAPRILFAIFGFIWAFFGVFFYILFHDSADAGICLVIMIAYPVVYGLWFICARSKVPGLLRELEQLERLRNADMQTEKGLGQLPQRDPQPEDWQCPCGRVNARYVSTCACGVRKRDIVNR